MFRARCVPNMYLFGTFSAQNAEEIAARDNDPSLQALQRAARGWVEEYGHPPAGDAIDGANAAKKRNLGRTPYRTFLSTIDLEAKTAPASAVTGP
jgi:hypothetical protein